MAGTADIDLRSGSNQEDVETAFVNAMDAAEAYVGSYEQLHSRLKEAYFELARARYAMGVHSISPAQFSSQMEASKLVHIGGQDTDSLFSLREVEQAEGVGQRKGSLSITHRQHIKQGYKKLEGSSPRQHAPRRQYQGQDSLISALEEKYVLSQPSEALQDSSSSESLDCLPQEPIHMLGGMVSPHLVQAKVHFTAAVSDAVGALNARHCMGRAIAAYTELQMSAYKQRKSAPAGDAGNKQPQEKAGSPSETASALSEQTTEVAEVTSRASQISIACGGPLQPQQ